LIFNGSGCGQARGQTLDKDKLWKKTKFEPEGVWETTHIEAEGV